MGPPVLRAWSAPPERRVTQATQDRLALLALPVPRVRQAPKDRPGPKVLRVLTVPASTSLILWPTPGCCRCLARTVTPISSMVTCGCGRALNGPTWAPSRGPKVPLARRVFKGFRAWPDLREWTGPPDRQVLLEHRGPRAM